MEVTKFRSQVMVALEQATLRLQHVRSTLTELGRSVVRVSKSELRKVLASSLDAIVVTNDKITNQLSVALEQLTVDLHRGQNAVTRLVKSAADKPRRLREAVRTRESDLQKVLASSLDAIVVTNDKITNQLSTALGQLTVHLHRGQNAVTRLVRSAADRPRRLREAARTRKSDLQSLLANSFEAVVVMNGDRRFVAANPAALYLFGVSEVNISRFTIDAFFPRGQIRYFDAKGSPLIGRQERVGKCEIRRLDGSIRVAEYVFVANFAPFQHLCRFVAYRKHSPRDQSHPVQRTETK